MIFNLVDIYTPEFSFSARPINSNIPILIDVYKLLFTNLFPNKMNSLLGQMADSRLVAKSLR